MHTLLVAGAFLAVAVEPRPTRAEPRPLRSLTVGTIAQRTGPEAPLRFVPEDHRPAMVEQLRAAGLNLTPEEQSDGGAAASLTLDATIVELDCAEHDGSVNCRIGIEWQLVDTASRELRYRTLTRGAHFAVERHAPAVTKSAMLSGLLSALLTRPRFRQAQEEGVLAPEPVADQDDPPVSRMPPSKTPAAAPTSNPSAAPRPASMPPSPPRAPIPRASGLDYVDVLRWVGLAVGVGGVVTATVTTLQYEPRRTTKREFEKLRLLNDLGWVAVALGTVAFEASFVIDARRAGAISPSTTGVSARIGRRF